MGEVEVDCGRKATVTDDLSHECGSSGLSDAGFPGP